ncbi:hypothetical protein Csa_018092 [Cucumis sativus]|uniref:Uncharacterized protein n=1 Tax=Cucumis sativus TaxID=3659 RepID=A0A0A0L1S9_CUCSA|nr:hypothetical protein Csa_018092 [Cucumis sativus]
MEKIEGYESDRPENSRGRWRWRKNEVNAAEQPNNCRNGWPQKEMERERRRNGRVSGLDWNNKRVKSQRNGRA